MSNCCPHRSFPLAKEYRKGDMVVCNYRGLNLTHFAFLHASHIGIGRKPDEGRPELYQFKILNFITPEARENTHNFWFIARDFALDDTLIPSRPKPPPRRHLASISRLWTGFRISRKKKGWSSGKSTWRRIAAVC